MKMMMMEMYFHFRVNEYILLKEWFPQTLLGFVLLILIKLSIVSFL